MNRKLYSAGKKSPSFCFFEIGKATGVLVENKKFSEIKLKNREDNIFYAVTA